MSLKEIFEDMKSLYFPQKRNKVGHLSLMVTKMMGGDMIDIKDFTVCVGEYIESKALSKAKFILASKPFSFSNDSYISSDSDFEIDPIHQSTPKVENLTTSFESRDQLIKRQNEEYENSLKADQLKEKEKKRKQEMEINKTVTKLEKEEHLISRQNARKLLVPPEPCLTEECAVIAVNHVTLGRQKRLFYCDSYIEDVYNWIGSLAPEPELFQLCISAPDQGICVLNPNDKVRKAEQQILMMRETSNSNLTMDIVSGSSMTIASDVVMISPELAKRKLTMRCPVCGERQSTDIIAHHADECASRKFVDVIESNSSDDDLDLIELDKTHCNKENNVTLQPCEILEALKLALNRCTVNQATVTKIKIRRKKTVSMIFVRRYQNHG